MTAPLIMVGLSGGVDSSVAALLLQQSGQRIAGLFMKNWEEDDSASNCTAEIDAQDAQAVCLKLGIPFYTRNFSTEYWDQVFTEFLAEYAAGRTPNPDVLCNREIKFKTFLEHAQDLGADTIATGHYARIDCLDGRYRLLRGRDGNKDQSYFLYTLGQPELSRTQFPIGELLKPDVRQMAEAANLITHAKKDSTGICFIGERNFREFLGRYLPARPGEMRTPDNQCVGQHQGVMYYTLGQRQGLGIGGRRDAAAEPWYVIGKNVAENLLYVAQSQENRWLQSTRLSASQLTWTAGKPPSDAFSCSAKTRYRQSDQECSVKLTPSSCEVHFASPQRAVTPGQSVVFYRDEECLGGGIIEATDAPYGGLKPIP